MSDGARAALAESSRSRCELRVRFGETDLTGVAHPAEYLRYFEAARVDWLRRRGLRHAEWVSRGLSLPVIEAKVEFRAPARFDDLLVVKTRLVHVDIVSMTLAYLLSCGDRLLAEGSTRIACIDRGQKLVRLPADLLQAVLSSELPSMVSAEGT